MTEPIVHGNIQTCTTAAEAASDEGLLQAFYAGDDAAFAAYYRRLRAPVYRCALGMFRGDADRAGDAFQEVFIRIYEQKARFNGSGSARAWIMIMTRNTCLNAMRGTPTLPIDACTELAETGPQHDPSWLAEQSDVQRSIAAAIDCLTEEQREAVVLREVDGMSYDDIAACTGTNVGIVRQRIWRARQRLRALLRPHLDTHEDQRHPR